MSSRLTLDLVVYVDDRAVWDGHTGGPIRNPDFHEGLMLTELAPLLEWELDKLMTVLRLRADPFGWMRSRGIVLAPQVAEASTDAVSTADAAATGLSGSTVDRPQEWRDHRSDESDPAAGWHDQPTGRAQADTSEGC